MTNLANQIERLSAAATPGEWLTAPDHISDQDYETCIELPGKAGQFGVFIADFHHNWAEDRISWKAAQSNAALCAALRNSVPQIIAALNAQAEVEALRARVAGLEKCLEHYAEHYVYDQDRKTRKALEAKP